MQLGMIGLGRMGASMVRRLLKSGHECVVDDREPSVVASLVGQGTTGAAALNDMVLRLTRQPAVWLMLPAAAVDPIVAELMEVLEAGDIIVDGGNSHCPDDIRRGSELKARSIHHADVETNGGVAGLERGYCLMVGGDADIFEHLPPIFSTLAPGFAAAPRTPGRNTNISSAEEGFLYCGTHGAGPFVKMVHNGIEYGVMAAYAEGLKFLRHADVSKRDREHVPEGDAETTPLHQPELYQCEMNLPDIAEVWLHGSVIGSWLLNLTAAALRKDPVLERSAGRVADSGEGGWTIQAAIDEGVPVPVLGAALFERFTSRGNAGFPIGACRRCAKNAVVTPSAPPHERRRPLALAKRGGGSTKALERLVRGHIDGRPRGTAGEYLT